MVSRLRRPLLALALAATATGTVVVAHHPQGANAEPVRATAVDLPPRPVVHTPKPTKGERAARIALRALGIPYRWGGESPASGFDCSGLVQVSLEAAGIAAPRDTDMQEAELGASVPLSDFEEGLQRGDLVFWKGHVGIMADSVTLIHANAHHMTVAAETLPEAMARISKAGTDIRAIKRLRALGA